MYYPHHHGDAISKVQILENSIAEQLGLFQQRNFKEEKKEVEGEPID